MPPSACGQQFKKELEFWQIDGTRQMSLCCMQRFNDGDFTKIANYFEDLMKNECSQEFFSEAFPPCDRRSLYNMLEYPGSSKAAKIPAIVQVMVSITAATAVYLNAFFGRVNRTRDDVIEVQAYLQRNYWINNTKIHGWSQTKMSETCVYIILVCIVCVFIDLVLRFALCPSKFKFLKSFFNVVDCVVVLSLSSILVIETMLIRLPHALFVCLEISGWFNIFLVVRLLKLVRQNLHIRIFYLVLKSSILDFCVFLCLFGIVSVLFASVVATVEVASETYFHDLVQSLWWAVITMTTVGYGDMYPVTYGGYAVGMVCVLTGMILTTLPIAVVSSNFNTFLAHGKQFHMHRKMLCARKNEKNKRNDASKVVK